MTIEVNGEKREISGELTIQGLLNELAYDKDAKVAVARNTVFVPRSAYEKEKLEAGDSIDFVAPMQGG